MNPFDPRILAKLKPLGLRARCVVDGVMVGMHPSRAKGFSSDFEQHREYTQGDDIRRIDWKAYGKIDRYFVKEYREATNLKAFIVLDCSASMGYGSNGMSKFDYGATLAASLAYLMLRQQDAVGLVTFSDRMNRMIPPKAIRGYLFAILKELEEVKPDGPTRGGLVLQELASSLSRRGLVIVISDLLDEPAEIVKGLRQLRSRGHEVIVFQLLDRDELELPFEDPTLFRDLESELKLLTDPQSIRSIYLEVLGSLLETYKKTCASQRIDYSLFDTTVGLDRALTRYLAWRAKFRRQ